MLKIIAFVFFICFSSQGAMAGSVKDAYVERAKASNTYYKELRKMKNRTPSQTRALKEKIITPAQEKLKTAVQETKDKLISSLLGPWGIKKVHSNPAQVAKLKARDKMLRSIIKRGASMLDTDVPSVGKGKGEDAPTSRDGMQLDSDAPELIEFKKKQKKKLTPHEEEMLKMGIHPQ